MKVYVVSYGWMSDANGIRPMTPRVYKWAADAKAFCDEWKEAVGTDTLNVFAFYDEIEVE